MQKKLMKVNASDNVAVALVNLSAGDLISFEGEACVIRVVIKKR